MQPPGPSGKVYHGTDALSSASIERIGLNLAAMRAAAGVAGIDEDGFAVTRDAAVARAWTALRDHQRRLQPGPLVLDRTRPVGFLHLGLHSHPGRRVLDPDRVVERMRPAFPEASFPPGDQAAAEAEQAFAFFAAGPRNHPEAAVRIVVESLWRKARRYGQTLAFALPRPTGDLIVGCVRAVGLTVLFNEPPAGPLQARLLDFLHSLGAGRIELMTAEEKGPTVLADLDGGSDCCREAAGLPWENAPP
jgi:hypothetical protein